MGVARGRSNEKADACASVTLFGGFRAELWEADEYVITCKAGVIGHTIDKRTAQWLPAWLNSAMAEAMTKLPNARTQRPGASDAPIANQSVPPGSLE